MTVLLVSIRPALVTTRLLMTEILGVAVLLLLILVLIMVQSVRPT